MNKHIAHFMLAIAAVGSSVGYGQNFSAPAEVTSESVEMRITQLESELASLQSAFCCAKQKSKCNACANQGGIQAGYSMFFAKPQMKESFEATIADVTTGTLSLVPFEFDNDLSPRVWLGYFGENGTGIRARYWQYDHNADPLSLTASQTTFPGVSSVTVIFPSAISTGAPGDVLTVGSGLEVHTLDIEGAMHKELMGIDVIASAGFRWASMEQHFDSAIVSSVDPPSILNWTRKFEGGGLTAAAEAKKWLAGSAIAVVGSARGSLLFGEKDLNRLVVGDVTPAPNNPPLVNLNDADEVSGIFELSVGAEWSHSLNNNSTLFLSSMYETQLWTAAGAPTLTFLGFDGISLAFGIER